MSNYIRAYSNFQEVKLLPIEQKPIPKDEYFPKPDEGQINRIVTTSWHIHAEKLLRFIHSKYTDQGLRITLIHKLFDSSSSQIAYYVPELVYIAIKKNCKHLKRLLLSHAKNNNSLRRLILWNVKAFTVLMKEKSAEIKSTVQQFENNLIEPVKDKITFTLSLKAIAMLTEASLILKKMPPETIKNKLEKFIKRFNAQILNNTHHKIIIPFRHDAEEKYESDYVVRLVQYECSCFPTRKRVPYRIIIQTIDIKQLQIPGKTPNQKFNNIEKVEADPERDLYNEVSESVEKIFQRAYMNIPQDKKNLFAVDTEQSIKYTNMKMYFNGIEKKQLQRENRTQSSIYRPHRSMTANLGLFETRRKLMALQKYKIQPSQNLTKFQSIYIPDIREDTRRSDVLHSNQKETLASLTYLNNSSKRKSDKYVKEEKKTNAHIYQEEVKESDYNSENFFGKPWQQSKLLYKKQSYFSKFDSLRLRNVVVKGGDDLRQQIICMQLIYKMKEIISEAKISIFIKPYEILVLSENSGILEFVSNSISIDQMKKKRDQDSRSISDFYSDIFNTQDKLEAARLNFVQSLVGSSIITYVLKLKDRHNGNILIDMDGHIIHIDFGFILGLVPGNFTFQTSPFKFTTEYLDFIGGKVSKLYVLFHELFHQGMRAVRDRSDEISLILQIMMEDSDLDCFKNFDLESFKNLFKKHYNEQKFKQYCHNLVQQSCENKMSVYYDNFQYFQNGIME